MLARAIELDADAEDFIPARLTVDLFAPVRTEPLTVHSSTVRRGRRIIMMDAAVTQSGEPRAHATAIYLPTTADPPGDLWHSHDLPPTPPPPGDSDGIGPPLIKSGDDDWTTDFVRNNNAKRKSIWQYFPSLVDDEPLTPFQNAALIAENTSLVCNWGTHGPGFINADTTLMLTRLPIGPELGLHADDQLSCNGVAVGAATLFDRHGPVGKCSVTALANVRRQRTVT
ncbi:acyl-CoA thioesterase domain-containing protein [Mycobacterium sp. LTG2003]